MTIEALGAVHLDETGAPCSFHEQASSASLLRLAVIGSRSSGFHHDLASKLQGLMMALDEITELVDVTAPPIAAATTAAQQSLQDILALLNASRALTKEAPRAQTPLRDLLARATERVYVTVRGDTPDAIIDVPIAPVLHALSLVLDVAAGPGRGRTLSAAFEVTAVDVAIKMTASPTPPARAAESIALATFVLATHGGELRCAGAAHQFVVRLPLATG